MKSVRTDRPFQRRTNDKKEKKEISNRYEFVKARALEVLRGNIYEVIGKLNALTLRIERECKNDLDDQGFQAFQSLVTYTEL